MKELLAFLKLIKARFRYFRKSGCKRCGYTGKAKAEPLGRGQGGPDG